MYKVYGYEECGYCRRAKALLQEHGLEHEFVLVPLHERASFLDEHGFTGSSRTFPKVWRGQSYVGGFSELEMEVLLS